MAQPYRLRLRVAVCAVCRGPICMEVGDPRCPPNGWSLQRQRQVAIANHFEAHPAAVLARWRERAQREPAPRACYTLDEALGSATLYAFWLTARHAGALSARNRGYGSM